MKKSLGLLFVVFLSVIQAFAVENQQLASNEDIVRTVSSSDGPAGDAGKALDGNPGTRWESSHGADPSWLKIELKKEKEISSVRIKWETASAKKYRLQNSLDGSDWKDIISVPDGKEGENRLLKFTPVKTKFLRILGEERNTQYGYSIWEVEINPGMKKYPFNEKTMQIEDRVNDLLGRMTIEEKVAQAAGAAYMETVENTRLGIPPIKMMDGPHGNRDGPGTCFPTGISMGATWEPELIKRAGIALGEESRAKGQNILLGPCINIHRHPYGGRNFESFSEDPYLAGRIAVGYVLGLQSQKVGASTKHFACNNQEWERMTISAEVDERTLREIYLPAFEMAVKEANTMTIMGAYNRVNGTYACAHNHLINNILKKDWGFQGFVVSDWDAVHGTEDFANGGLDLEMPGPPKFFGEKLLAAVKSGKVTEEVIDDKARRIFRVMFTLGMFDEPDSKLKAALDTEEHRTLAREVAENAIVLLKNKNETLPLKKDKIKSIAVLGPNAAVARLGGGGSSEVKPFYSVSPLEGLKNKCGSSMDIIFEEGAGMADAGFSAIPQDVLSDISGKTKGLSAEYFTNRELQGAPALKRTDPSIDFDWSANGPGQGISKENYSVRWTGKLSPKVSGRYKFSLTSDDGSRVYLDNKLLIDNWGDHAAVTITASADLTKGKNYDIKVEYYQAGGEASVKLGWLSPDSGQDPKLAAAFKAASKADIAIVFAGLNLRVEGEGNDKKSLLLPDEQVELIRGVAAANKNTIVVLINGTPVTMEDWQDKVAAIVEAWYPGQEGGNAIANILFGEVNPSGKMPCTFPEKYEDMPSASNYPGANGKVNYAEGIFVGYRHFDKNEVKPLFPFGHGLSYTSFGYSNMKISIEKADAPRKINVSLEVKNTGKVKGKEVVQLYVSDIKSSVPRPVKELKGFKKIELEAGESRKVDFILDDRALAFYDTVKKDWVVEPGEFEILAGSSSQDIRQREKLSVK